MPISAKELALELGTDARTARKFLRDIVDPEEQPGQGGRWNFEKKQVKGLKKKFADWQGTKTKKQTATVSEDDVEELSDNDIEELELDDEDEIEEI